MSEEKKEKPVIILHQFPRAKNCPSPSPFALKVETFLRMNRLSYTSDFKDYMGPKGKCPWITDTDETVVADSQFIIEYLTDKHNIQMLNLSPDDAAIARGMRVILEDNLYFVLLTENSIFGSMTLLTKIYSHLLPRGAPKCCQQLVLKKVKAGLASQARAQGIGRHSREEVHSIGLSDLEALSICLGDKHYMMGLSPSPLDCTAFGFLATLFYNFPDDYYFKKEAEEKFPNLKSYTERIKKIYWPDWDELSG